MKRKAADEDRDKQGLERTTFFSDAVFAIAMTLLIVEVKLPHIPHATGEELGQALLNLIPNYIGFLVSFSVLGRFWIVHHEVMGVLKGTNRRLIAVNLLLLLAVAFMPFPTAVISEHVQLRVAVGFYTGWLVVLGVLNRQLIRSIIASPELLDEDVAVDDMLPILRRSWTSIAIGVSAFAGGMVSWIAALAVLTVGSPLISIAIGRYASLRSASAK
ncbi:TMEM175 family protein [Sphingomonas japonica]|uniref:Membrane protein n=1 Tax=Sphingomonas japonica TaxID=511662 RepID=A0ABX0U1M1_9SPHN|nr:TMEM175 family protein [Sphingomonas japonica]NIJ24458.1 putative membrane protein [Sphingomonas japonica]